MLQFTSNKMLLLTWITWICYTAHVDGYSAGAPKSTCLTRYPKHKVGTQRSSPQYDILLSQTYYKPGDTLTVTVVGKADVTFTGIQMAAYRAVGNVEEVLGQFIDFPTDKIKTFSCIGSFKDNMITHKDNQPISNLTITWLAPRENVGDIIFKTTIVQSFDVFWVDIKTNLSTLNNSNVDYGIKLTAPVQLMSDINFSDCGDSKGCFLYPVSCSGSDCLAAVTFQHDPDSDSYLFELMSNNEQDYVSLGFSEDNLMGEDEFITCSSHNGIHSIQYGWNPAYFSERQSAIFTSDVEIKKSDGRLQCRFKLPNTTYIYIIDQSTESYQYFNKTYDHLNEWYLQIAWGPVMPASDVIGKHIEIPPVTYRKINLKEKDIFRGSAFGFLVQAHAVLMILAWMFLTGIVTVISRHYREWMPRIRWCGTKVWFQVHRAMAFAIVFCTVLSLTLVFVQYGVEIRKSSIPHSYIGISVLTLVIVQVIAGLLRPGPDDKLRVYFNSVHQLLGQIIHLLAALTMYLGFNMLHTIKSVNWFGLIVLSIWLGGQVLWHLIFEIIKCKSKQQDSNHTNGDTDKDKKDKLSNTLTVVFIVYVTFLLIVSLAAMSAVFIY